MCVCATVCVCERDSRREEVVLELSVAAVEHLAALTSSEGRAAVTIEPPHTECTRDQL